MIEDDEAIGALVGAYLEQAGFDVVRECTGEGGLEAVERPPPRFVVLDLGLPDFDGLELCRQLRSCGDVPILILTARDEEADRIIGLELGADDYLTKPFSPRELVARVRAVLRRAEPMPPDLGRDRARRPAGRPPQPQRHRRRSNRRRCARWSSSSLPSSRGTPARS